MHLLQYTRRKTSSYSLTIGEAGREEYDYARCCHCQLQWRIVPGSGIVRGWCSMCGQPTCGSRRCQSCVPFERAMEREELRQRLFAALGL